jgi:hypothetical protein
VRREPCIQAKSQGFVLSPALRKTSALLFPRLGPSHAKCNQRAGWENMVASANGGRIDPQEKPYKWSQRWCEDPPPGTTVNLGNGLVEIHIGRGIWQTVDASERVTVETFHRASGTVRVWRRRRTRST